MGELALALGGTPLGILLVVMLFVVVFMTWTVAVYITKFKYHEYQDRQEFERVDKRLTSMESTSKERTHLLHEKIDRLGITVHNEIQDFRHDFTTAIASLKEK